MNLLLAATAETGSLPIEESIIWLVQWLKLGIETIGAALVVIGVVVAIVQLLKQFAARQTAEFTGHPPHSGAIPRARARVSTRG